MDSAAGGARNDVRDFQKLGLDFSEKCDIHMYGAAKTKLYRRAGLARMAC
jgi:hypothetical protein